MGLSSRLSQLDGLRRRWSEFAEAAGGLDLQGQAGTGRLREVAEFGLNPGALKMHLYAPERLAPDPALVVVLHGCTQSAAGYDAGAGWSTLAERYGFVLVCPEQTRVNNGKACFNWFLPEDIARGSGEARSIRSMVDHALRATGASPSRVFVTGLSAGGAMTAVMLATYPEVFAGGAIVAGLPYGGARNAQEALDLMFHPAPRPAREWGDLVRRASPHRGPWPRVSVWHGDKDATVRPENAAETVKQWTDVLGLSATSPSARERIGRHRREVWRDAAGREVVETVTVAGLAHGTPIDGGPGERQCGQAGPFLIEAGISSSWHIARFFGLTERVVTSPEEAAPPSRPDAAPRRSARAPAAAEPLAVIQKALRSAGLLR